MDIVIYALMALFGFVGSLNEILYHKTNKYNYILFVVLFVSLAVSRTIRTMNGFSTGDLTAYIYAFRWGSNHYFEPGYVLFSDIVRFIFGREAIIFILLISTWFVVLTQCASHVCFNNLMDLRIVNKVKAKSLCKYGTTFLFCISLYWGSFFICETIRIGMATALLYLVTALYFSDKKIPAILFGVVAIFFHYSTLIYIAVLFFLYFVKNLSKQTFLIVFVAIVIYEIISIDLFDVAGKLFQVLNADDSMSHYATAMEVNEEIALGGFSLSPQNLFYHLVGLVVLQGNLKNKYYNKVVQIYYVGLLFGALFSFTPLAMRMQWLFYSQICWAFFFFIIDARYSKFSKISIILLYSATQIVLIFRQFGGYI